MRAFAPPEPRPIGTVVVDGGPGALWFDPITSLLHVADELAGAVVAVREACDGRVVARLDATPGGVTMAPDGALLVARARGSIVRVEPSGAARDLGGVDRRPLRAGLAVDRRRNVLHSAASLKPCGWIEQLDLATERLVGRIEGFADPSGLAVAGDRLFVADRARGELVAVDLADRGRRRVVARGLPAPDSVAIGPGSTMLVTCWCAETGVGYLHRVWVTGRVRCIWRTKLPPGGVAWDGAARLFVSLRGRAGVVVLRC